jgi:oligoribonuclease NrnB/cAMP/cGMP phosphodiesterase (DHH superfamily)
MLYHKCDDSSEYKEIISLNNGKCPHCGEYFPIYDDDDYDFLKKIDLEKNLIDLLKNKNKFMVT